MRKKGKIKYREFLEEAEAILGERPTHIACAEALHNDPNANALGARLHSDGYLKPSEYAALKRFFLEPKTENEKTNAVEAEGKTYKIPYWEGCYKEEFKDLLLKDGVTECMMDYQVLVNEWGCVPENLRILAMPGEEMDGGSYPLKNQDLLIIDVARTDTIESGVFVATSHGGTRIYVREIVERMSDEFMFFTTITNPKWKEYISKKWTMEQWKQSDIQIVGRVIKNMSLKL